IQNLGEAIGRRDLLTKKPDLGGKAALIDLATVLSAPHARVSHRDYRVQTAAHLPKMREQERCVAQRAMGGDHSILRECLNNEDRCVGVGAAGEIARKFGDLGLPEGTISFDDKGAAGHFYAAYSVHGMNFRLKGLAADSCFTAAYGGTLAILPPSGNTSLTVVGNTFGYGARGGQVFIAGRAGNRFGICLRKNAEGGGATIVVEGVASNAFQYMTGGVALVLGPTGPNLGAGMTGGVVYLLDADLDSLNQDYVKAEPVDLLDRVVIEEMLAAHVEATGSLNATLLLEKFDLRQYSKVTTRLLPETLE
ncbi:MAG: hypothetical protein H7Y17_01495, partial [Chlorobia bacterium]|nr:hypothetical protein [Fimbriimonadaceae bacterium]